MKRTIYFKSSIGHKAIYVFPNGNYTGFSLFPAPESRRGFDWTQDEMDRMGCELWTRKQAEKYLGRKLLRAHVGKRSPLFPTENGFGNA